jgi:C1A family cysteine protease
MTKKIFSSRRDFITLTVALVLITPGVSYAISRHGASDIVSEVLPCPYFTPSVMQPANPSSLRASSLPSAFSVPNLVEVPTTRDQGQGTATCWAYSAISAIEFNYAYKLYNAGSIATPDSFSVRHLIDNRGFTTPENYGGTVLYPSAYFSAGIGPALHDESSFSHYFTDISFFGNLSIDSIKSLIHTYGHLHIPISIKLVEPNSSFFDATNHSAYIPTSSSAGLSLDHAVVIVGWDDSFNHFDNLTSKPAASGAWLVQNSWGPDFGDQGYFYLSYYSSMIGKPTAFSGEIPRGDNDTILQKDRFGNLSQRTFSINDTPCEDFNQISFIPVSSTLDINRVGFWITNKDGARASCSVTLYKASDFPQLRVAVPLATADTSNLGNGYHSLPITAKIESGETLCVVLRTTGTPFVPVEVKGYPYTTFTQGSMQYISLGDEYKTFNVPEETNRNLCIKVYARKKILSSVPKTISDYNQERMPRKLLQDGHFSIFLPNGTSYNLNGAKQ